MPWAKGAKRKPKKYLPPGVDVLPRDCRPAERACLWCGAKFPSAGPAVRKCPACRSRGADAGPRVGKAAKAVVTHL